MKDAPTIQIRQADAKDAERLAAIGVETFKSAFGHLYPPDDFLDFASTYHSPEAYRRILSTEDCRAWIAEAAHGEAVGYAVAGPCSLPVPGLLPNSGELAERTRSRQSVRWRGRPDVIGTEAVN